MKNTARLQKGPGNGAKQEVSPDSWVDQEGFVISVHGTKLKITAARFSVEYLTLVNSKIMPVRPWPWICEMSMIDWRHFIGRQIIELMEGYE